MSELENIINELEEVVFGDRCSAELLGMRVRIQWAEIKSALRSTPPAVSVVPEWRPIETAPKDGTKFLIWVANGYGHGHVKTGLFNERYDGVASIFDDGEALGHLREKYATHWMPFPSPPPQNKGER